MPVRLTTNASFSSKAELLDLHDGTVEEGPSLDSTPSGSQTSSPLDSGPRSPCSPDGPHIFTVASSLPGQLWGGRVGAKGGGADLVNSDPLCGWGQLTPRALQRFNSPRWVLVFLCAASFLQGMIINGFINTVITSIERRFDLRSYQAGLIASSYDIAACLCLAFVSYFGGTGHKPRWLGWGVVVMALGSLVFAMPHFTTPPYKVSVPERSGLCYANSSTPCGDEEGAGLSGYRYVFMLGQFLHGVGATPLYTLGVTYLDENVESTHAPVYIGIFYTAAILGPAAGYLLGGYFLNRFTEISVTPSDVFPENPLWVGAWWVGFIAGGAAALIIALPILGYPRTLPGSQALGSSRISEAHQMKDGSHMVTSDPQFGKSVKDMPRSVVLLLKNPTFLFLCLSGATEATLIAGVSTFGPKFLESQFSLSASEAATWFGYMVVPAGGGGTFLGGYIVKRLNLRCRGIIRFCLMCATVSLLANFIFLIHCPNLPMAGITAPYRTADEQQSEQQLYDHGPGENSSSLQLSLSSDCNSGCRCVREAYHPVCGADGLMYYSPCHAGCSYANITKHPSGHQVYSGCTCVLINVSHADEGLNSGSVLAGKCSSSCNHMGAFLSLFFILILFTFLSSIPALTATLRCVPDSQRSFGLGIQWIVVRTFGSIPGPIAFGSFIDLSCLLWQDQCGEHGSCYLYHNSTMSRYTLIAGIIYKLLGMLFFLLASIMYTPPPHSPQSSCESAGQSGGGGADLGHLPFKNLPEDSVITTLHATL